MNEMNTQAEDKDKRPLDRKMPKERTGMGVAIGAALFLAGITLFAKEMGWLPSKINWLLPAIIVGLGVGFLRDSFKR